MVYIYIHTHFVFETWSFHHGTGTGIRGGTWSSWSTWSTWSAWSAVELLASWSKHTKRCAKSVVSGVNDLHMLGFPHGNLWDSLHGGNQETYGDTSNTWEHVDISGI